MEEGSYATARDEKTIRFDAEDGSCPSKMSEPGCTLSVCGWEMRSCDAAVAAASFAGV